MFVKVADISVLDGVDLLIEGVILQKVLVRVEARDDTVVQDEDAVTVLHA